MTTCRAKGQYNGLRGRALDLSQHACNAGTSRLLLAFLLHVSSSSINTPFYFRLVAVPSSSREPAPVADMNPKMRMSRFVLSRSPTAQYSKENVLQGDSDAKTSPDFESTQMTTSIAKERHIYCSHASKVRIRARAKGKIMIAKVVRRFPFDAFHVLNTQLSYGSLIAENLISDSACP